jgi:amino acid transporter
LLRVTAVPVGGPRLRHATLSQLESLGQSIANIAPTLTPAINVAVVAKLAGAGSWLSFAFATVGMMVVAANIGALARRHPQSGSYFIYIGRIFGPFAGAMAGWAMIAAYVFTAVSVGLSFTIFVGAVLYAVGLAALTPPAWLLIVGFVAVVWFAGYRDIQVSSRLALVLEGLSVGVVVLVIALVVMRHGGLVDPAQLDIRRLHFGGITSSLAFAVFCFVGFESAATLAKETRDPQVAVPRAIMISAAGVGLFFTAMTYLMVLGMGGDAAALGASGAPFTDMTAKAGVGWVAGIVYGSAMISSFACALACVNAASRMLYSMGRYATLPGRLGTVHARHRTPHVAVTLACGVALVAGLVLLPIGALDAFGLTGTFATLGFLVVYLLVCIAAPIDLRRSGGVSSGQVALGAIGVVLVGFVMVGAVWPVPPYPYDLLVYLFGLYMAGGAAWFLVLRRLRPQALVSLDQDLEM